MKQFNLNDFVIIYPTRAGFEEIKHLYGIKYGVCPALAAEYIDEHRMIDGGFGEQLWKIAADFGNVFTSSKFMHKTTIKLATVAYCSPPLDHTPYYNENRVPCVIYDFPFDSGIVKTPKED